jgi:hypothetical protein
LTANRKTFSVAQTPVAAEIHQPLYIHGDVPAQIAFDLDALVDALPDSSNLGLSQIVGSGIHVHAALDKYFLRGGSPYSVDIGQCNLDPLVFR